MTSRLLLLRCILALILLGVLVVGSRRVAWPLVTWPMYAYRIVSYPEDTISKLELRVRTRGGETVHLDRHGFFPAGRASVARRIIEESVAPEDSRLRSGCRRALEAMVSRALPGEQVVGIEVWRVVWSVDPLARPPLDRASPARRLLLGRFDLEAPTGATSL